MIYTDDNMADLKLELNDQEIWNDILNVIGDLDDETLVRGVSPTSVQYYGRRSYKVSQQLGKDQATVQTLISDRLDKYDGITNMNVPIITFRLVGITDELIEEILSRQVGDKIQIQSDEMCFDKYFWLESVSVTLNTGIIQGDFECLALLIGEE